MELDDKTGELIYEVAKKLSSNSSEVLNVLDKLIELERSGMFDEVLRLAETTVNLVSMMEAVDHEAEEIITKNLEILMSVGILLANNNVRRLIDSMEEALLNVEYQPTGLAGLIKAMRDPEVKKAIGFFIGLLKEFGKRL